MKWKFEPLAPEIDTKRQPPSPPPQRKTRSKWRTPPPPPGVILPLVTAPKGRVPHQIDGALRPVSNHKTARAWTDTYQRFKTDDRSYYLLPLPLDYNQRHFFWAALYSLRPSRTRKVNKSYLLLFSGPTQELALIAASSTQAPLLSLKADLSARPTMLIYLYHVSPKLDFVCDQVNYRIEDNIWDDTQA